MKDPIERQAAIDALNKLDVSDGVGISSIACGVQELAIISIQHLPSAQPEIVQCKDCKHNQLPATSGNANCEIYYGMTDQDGFCHMAERRTDE